MASAQILFPMEPEEFWRQMKLLVEEVVDRKINAKPGALLSGKLADKSLLKITELCEIFQVTKPTIHDWIKQGKIKSIKVQSRRYFLIEDVEQLIKSQSNSTTTG